MSTVELSNPIITNQQLAFEDRLNKGELLSFCDLLAPYQDVSVDPSRPDFVMDEARKQANQDLLAFLRSKYGEKNVITSSLNVNGKGQIVDMPGLIGVYINSMAFEFTHFIDSLLVCDLVAA